MGLLKARSRETIGGLRVDRLESTQLDYGKGERLGSEQLDDGREGLSSGQLGDGRKRLGSEQLGDGREGLGSGQLDDGHLEEVTVLMVESLQERNWVVDRELMVRGRSCWVDGRN